MRFIAVLLSILFIIVGVKLAVTGNKQYDEAQIFQIPEHLSYEKFASERPLLGWFEIAGGKVDLTEGACVSPEVSKHDESKPNDQDIERLKHGREIYVPVHNPDSPHAAADIILLTRDPELLGDIRAQMDKTNFESHADVDRILKGMVRLPSELPDAVRRTLGNSISTQSIIIEENAGPAERRAFANMGAGGLLLLITAVMWLIIWRGERSRLILPVEYMPDDLFFDELEEGADAAE